MTFIRPAIVLLLVLGGALPPLRESGLGGIWPAVVALAAVVILRQAALGLVAGGVAGALILAGGNPLGAVTGYLGGHLFPALAGTWHIAALVFTLILGGFAGALEAGGGFGSLVRRLTARIREPRRDIGLATVALGFVCFFDGLANSLLLGRLMRPLADRHGLSRAKLSFLVDSTSASVACVAVISTWIATQLSLIGDALAGTRFAGRSYELFFRSIPGNYYCLFTLVLVALVAWRGWNIGPMRRFESEARAGRGTEKETDAAGSGEAVPIRCAWIPLLTLVLSIPAVFAICYLWQVRPLWPVDAEKLDLAFNGGAGPFALTFASVVGLITAVGVLPRSRRSAARRGARKGAAAMLMPLTVLVAAWALGSILGELGTAERISTLLGGSVRPAFFPAAVFVTASGAAFLTGTSWGTMGLMMPLAVPVIAGMVIDAGAAEVLLPLTIAAVFSGAVFGDHCSPFSDTTIVSAIACGIRPLDHVLTQLPYAMLSAAVAVIGFLIAGGTGSLAAPLLGGSAVLVAVVLSRTRSDRR